jgi:hypothetical protein
MPSPSLAFLVLAYIKIDMVICYTGSMFREFEGHDFARTGSTVTETVIYFCFLFISLVSSNRLEDHVQLTNVKFRLLELVC